MNPRRISCPVVISFVLVITMRARCQTNFPAYRQVSNQVYNVALSQRWTTVVPVDASPIRLDQGKVARGQLLTIHWHEGGKPDKSVTVLHVPYEPANFQGAAKTSALKPLAVPMRVFFVHGATNYTANDIVTRVDLTYDFGLPPKKKPDER